MTEHRTVDERIAMWLEDEAQGHLPDRVLEATFGQTRASRQRPAPFAWRLFTMSRPVTTLLAVGAAAIVVAVGFNALRPATAPSVVGTSPSIAPTAEPRSSAPTVAPSAVLDKPLGLAIINLDGTIKQDLGLPQDAWMADLTQDGAKIAFSTTSTELGFCGACVNAGTSHRVAVIDVGAHTGSYVYPNDGPALESAAGFAWSPDGRRLAFSATGADGNVDIYVLDAVLTSSNPPMTGGAVRRLTTDPRHDEFPAWTPDGNWILYDNSGSTPLDDSGFSPTQEIWRVSADGGSPKRLTDNADADSQPDVAADGTVAYWHGGDIWTMTQTGQDQQPLARVPAELGFNPRWSPDGSKIAVLVYDPSERAHMDLRLRLPGSLPLLKVFVVDLASGTVSEVGPRVPSDVNPVSWTPDGSALLVYRYDQPN